MKHFGLFFLLVVALSSCNPKTNEVLFIEMDAKDTNVHFTNAISPTDEINIIDFQYCYNGGGVGIGDFNKDNFPDLVFTGNQVSSKIYLNQGSLKFMDITEQAGFTTASWVTGVSIVDINEDGWDDIYLNVGGSNCSGDCTNLLFVNQGLNGKGIPTFKEEAKAYNLDESEYAQQTVFFDFDTDGDLDAFILRNGNVNFDKNSPLPKKYFPEHLTDILLEKVIDSSGNQVYRDVSKEMGITKKGFGLGVGINDFNHDGLPDIYVGNDFITNDAIYINRMDQQSLGFVDMAATYMSHQTYNSMGVDLVDINNDENPDITVLDMLPDGYDRQKKMIGQMNYDKYQLALANEYIPQYMRNTVHLHNGNIEGELLKFSDVSFIAGIAKTDWSWTPLWADYDCDGTKDLFVTNGYGKDITDLDFINYTQQNNVYGSEEAKDKRLKELVARQPEVKLQNFFFKNDSVFNIRDVTANWLSPNPSLSNGAAYADLDLDGDLDLIVNNLDQKAFVLQNLRSEMANYHYLKVKLEGTKQNKYAIGAKVKIWSKGKVQVHYQSVVRGYLSSVEAGAFFGLEAPKVDSIQVLWPTGKVSEVGELEANQTITFSIQDAKELEKEIKSEGTILQVKDEKVPFIHIENQSNDFVFQNLLLSQQSKMGPCLAKTKLEGLAGEVLFIGGSHGQPGYLLGPDKDGDYSLLDTFESEYEDAAALFLDIDNDGDEDLYIGSGGSEKEQHSEYYQDRIYINQGNAKFKWEPNRLPTFKSSTSCVSANDFDKDGDMDLFVGSGIAPKEYPRAPKSRILINEDGRFVEKANLELQSLGMVKDAIWQDLDDDGWDDLIIIGDWMPIEIYRNHSGNLKKWEGTFFDISGEKRETNGWWRTIEMADFDNDGDPDFLVGNQGLNNFINPDKTHPIYIYTKDFDSNGSIDPLIGAFLETKQGLKLKPMHSRDDVMKQLGLLKNQFRSYSDFASADFVDLLKIQSLTEETISVNIFESIYLENLGDFNFKIRPLPIQCQYGPINDFLVNDFNRDGTLDVLAVGNDFQSETNYGGHDAINGLFLEGNKSDFFTVISESKSGFYVPGQSNCLIELDTGNNESLVVAPQNNAKVKVFLRN
ncbi:VCBS repeat-containing protein [Flagellimonas sp.]|uniref:VCBS repeat-containing protein n=1 Tax=Flagellimonas sp. TaxID=2058762 RepID=UPI003F49F47D